MFVKEENVRKIEKENKEKTMIFMESYPENLILLPILCSVVYI